MMKMFLLICLWLLIGKYFKLFLDLFYMDNNQTQALSEPTTEQVQNAIANLDPRVTLRNLAFWLDLAIAQGRMFDALLKPDNNKEQEVSGNDASAGE